MWARTKAKKSGLRVIIIYWKLTAQEFKDIFDIDYTNVGLTILSLIVPGRSEMFHGVIVRDHPRIRTTALGIKFEYYVEIEIADLEMKLYPADVLREDQHTDVMAYLELGGGEDEQLKIMRLKGTTVKDIEAKKGELVAGEAKRTTND